jgi:hypothetical protein
MQYERLTYFDIEQIKSLQPDGWPDITEAFRFYCNYDYCNPIKVSLDKKIIGIGNSIMFDKSAWLAHIIVGNDFRNQGIGFKIVDLLQNDIKEKGIDTSLLIATELGEPVYMKAGFRKVSDYRYFKKENDLIKKNFSKNIHPYNPDFYTDIIQLDNYILGENRERLLKNYLNESFVFLKNNEIKGLFIPNLGEGLIYSLTPEAGKELMRFKYSSVDKATIPGENLYGIEFLKESGFVETSTKGKRMICGHDIEWKPTMIYSRIGGNFG